MVAVNLVAQPLMMPVFVAVGLAVGATGPSRDLIVRNATPRGAAGRVYGFVYSGLDIGSMLGPVWFGMMLDHGLAREVLLVIGGLLVIAIATVVQVRRSAALRPA
jgi:MFS family permease